MSLARWRLTLSSISEGQRRSYRWSFWYLQKKETEWGYRRERNKTRASYSQLSLVLPLSSQGFFSDLSPGSGTFYGELQIYYDFSWSLTRSTVDLKNGT